MIIYVLENGAVRVSFVVDVWKTGSKKKPLTVQPCLMQSCHGFRAIQLEPVEDSAELRGFERF